MLKGTATKWLVAAGVAVAIVAFAPEGTWAAGDPPPEPPKEKPKPKQKEKKEKKDKNSALDQDQVYSLGYWQAKNGEHGAALATLRTARDQDDPRVQTMIGFTLRSPSVSQGTGRSVCPSLSKNRRRRSLGRTRRAVGTEKTRDMVRPSMRERVRRKARKPRPTNHEIHGAHASAHRRARFGLCIAPVTLRASAIGRRSPRSQHRQNHPIRRRLRWPGWT